ncbi:tetratricopeptide repeat protein, partial [bacterium]
LSSLYIQQWRDSKTLFSYVNKVEGESAYAYSQLGGAAILEGDRAGAYSLYGKALSLNPDYKEALLARARLEMESGAYEKAALGFQRVSSLDNGDFYALYELGLALIRLGNGKEAFFAAQKLDRLTLKSGPVAELARMKADLWGKVAVETAKAGDSEGAAVLFGHAISLAPDYAENYYLRGVSKDQSGDLEGAAEDYQKVLELSPGDYMARFNLGAALYRLGERKGAARHFLEFKKMQPASDMVENFLRDNP